ncbi:AAA family ATPase [Candidatus Halobeggiatoa sp. HSG11]|nr:AAA family ATPase [Candidatus Halobeggiatoa sp. HSG11]
MLTLPNYQVTEQIYESVNSTIYRGIRNKDNQAIILKMLKQDYPTPAELTRYQQEYEITHGLNLAGVIKTYSIEKYQNTLVIVLEDFGGKSLKQIIADQPCTVKEFLTIAIQITDILGNIHAANIIHKDINPDNIIINPNSKELKIIDFGIASRLPRENPTLKNPEQLEGTLPYLSPEQTGRINRSIDYRTDLYSLGITFYEMLTGKLPFENTDAMELVHCHIAKIPLSAIEVNPEIPQIISDIIDILLVKNAEERYQSAFGLKLDFEKLQVFDKYDNVYFKLAKNNLSGQFQIPQKLYGREEEINSLLQAFERVSNGDIEMMLVAGYSGVGKSALVHEVHKPMTEKRGYFADGKFDQFQKNIPYSAITQAFNKFCRYLLLEKNLTEWQQKILAVVGNNGQIIIDVIPDLELVIGKQPTVAEVGPTEAQNRFQMLFLNFVKALCGKEHPFILFIDDLQWVDSASLALLKSIMLDDEIQYLLIIGAYRDNEVDKNHPFIIAVETLEAVKVNTIELKNLQLSNVNHLLQNTLQCEAKQSQPLTELLYQKTQGNAFFTRQFLQSLYDSEFLYFEQYQWHWDVEQIKNQNITANVVELMIGQLKKLPEATQQVLRLAACVGNNFDLATLAIIHEQSQSTTAQDLSAAIQTGLILPTSELEMINEQLAVFHYNFLHDRVQQAAYALIDDDQKKAVHLKIGQLLLANSSEVEENIFNIVDHFNMGIELITNEKEKIKLAQLNLEAGKKAKDATAYEAALQYFISGIQYLNVNSWVVNYNLTFDLYKEKSEIEFLNGNFEQSEKLINFVLDKTQTVAEKATLYSMLIVQYTMLARYEEATQAGRKALNLMDIDLPEIDLDVALQTEMDMAKENLGNRQIASVVDAAEMTNSLMRASTQVLVKLITTTYQSNQALFAVVVVKIVNASLKYGNISESPFGYSAYGLLLGSVFGDYKTGDEFVIMALRLSEKFHTMSQKCAVCDVLVGHAYHWTHPLKDSLIYSDEGYQAGLESGELQVTGYIMMFKLYNLFSQGSNLKQLLEEISGLLTISQKHQNQLATDTITGCQIGVLNLTNLNTDKFENADMDDVQLSNECTEHQTILALCMYQILKLQILYLYDKPIEALKCSEAAEQQIAYVLGVFCVAEHNFYTSLTLLAFDSVDWKKLNSNQQQMKIWADNCPENFLHKYLLVQAEIARIKGNELEAMDLYDQAIASAKEHEFIQNEALANELAAKFWLGRNKEEIAQVYLKKAYYCYQQWGATAKVNDLETKYQQLSVKTTNKIPIDSTIFSTRMASISMTNGSQWLDLNSAMKAARTLSREIVLSKLLEKMMHIVIENAGAEKGFLLLPKQDDWFIEAEGHVNGSNTTVLQSLPFNKNKLVSTNIVNYVINTKENIVLNDATQEGNFTNDQYIVKHRPQSVLCIPLLNQSQLAGILYLENSLTTGAFTAKRIEILNLLSSQIAISIENSLLYIDLEQKIEAAKAADKAKSSFLASMSHELRTPLNAILGFAQIMHRSKTLPKEHQENASIINRSGEYLLSLINDILNMSKIEAGKITLDVRQFDLYALLNDVQDLFYPSAKDKNLQLSIDHEDNVPQYLLTDATKLRQILLNIIGNAVKFTNEGSVYVHVKASFPTEQQVELIFTVKDTGVGVAEDEIDKMFEAFSQTASGRDSYNQGTGLGLSISHKFLQLMQGDISVTSKINQGTEFVFNIFADVVDNHEISTAVQQNMEPSELHNVNSTDEINASTEMPEQSMPEALAMLSTELLAEFAEAIEVLDTEKTQVIIDKIRLQNEMLANSLENLANEFQFDKLQNLIEQVNTNE